MLKQKQDTTARLNMLEAFFEGLISDKNTLNALKRNIGSIKAILKKYFDTLA